MTWALIRKSAARHRPRLDCPLWTPIRYHVLPEVIGRDNELVADMESMGDLRFTVREPT